MSAISGLRARVAAANAAVEAEMQGHSDEMEEEEVVDGDSGELDTSRRLNQPQSHNRSLFELYREDVCRRANWKNSSRTSGT
jgi:hypothetical protein